MVSPAPVRDVGIQFLGLKRSLKLLARLGESAEKEPELEGAQLQPGKPKPDRLWPTLSNPNPSLLITTLLTEACRHAERNVAVISNDIQIMVRSQRRYKRRFNYMVMLRDQEMCL
eukprot:superscaffoldBa00002001_g12810